MKRSVWMVGLVLVLWPAASRAQLELHGFVESGTAVRLGDVGGVPAEWGSVPAGQLPAVWAGPQDFLMREARLQLRGDLYGDVGEAHFVMDALEDGLRQGSAEMTLREGYVKFNALGDHLEVRAGRQPTTWGTGDLLFINDLFPKDWVSFFIGREDQYLKLPSDAVRLGIYGLPVGVDLVYTPQFTADNLPQGERLAFWAPAFVPTQLPTSELGNGEFALRLNRYFGSINAAFYGYVGFWKSPLGMRVEASSPVGFYYPELRSWGGSLRGPLFGGVAWAEGAYYDSADDPDGVDPLVPNSEWRGMVGYERSWWSDFTGGMQFYWEGMQDYAAARSSLDAAFGPQAFLKDENRTLLTVRLRQQLLYQTLTLGVFGFYSPTDEDSYVRLTADYDYSDQLKLTAGANLFQGKDSRTLFGMNDQNDSVYGRIRLSF